ncbi:hypothetical protein VDGD_21367 [Verticillium dahliae]|nr:hypothetical protein VDGD_21367 [Verticillium dahliae]
MSDHDTSQTVISISFIKRKAGTTPEQFYHHWEKVHGPLVRPWMKKHGFISYTQVSDRWPSRVTLTVPRPPADAPRSMPRRL